MRLDNENGQEHYTLFSAFMVIANSKFHRLSYGDFKDNLASAKKSLRRKGVNGGSIYG